MLMWAAMCSGLSRSSIDMTLSLWHAPRLTGASGWVQTNRPAIAAGEKVCISARSIFLWNRLPLEVVYSRSERTQLLQQPGSLTVNRQLTAGDVSAGAATDAGQELLSIGVL